MLFFSPFPYSSAIFLAVFLYTQKYDAIFLATLSQISPLIIRPPFLRPKQHYPKPQKQAFPMFSCPIEFYRCTKLMLLFSPVFSHSFSASFSGLF